MKESEESKGDEGCFGYEDCGLGGHLERDGLEVAEVDEFLLGGVPFPFGRRHGKGGERGVSGAKIPGWGEGMSTPDFMKNVAEWGRLRRRSGSTRKRWRR